MTAVARGLSAKQPLHPRGQRVGRSPFCPPPRGLPTRPRHRHALLSSRRHRPAAGGLAPVCPEACPSRAQLGLRGGGFRPLRGFKWPPSSVVRGAPVTTADPAGGFSSSTWGDGLQAPGRSCSARSPVRGVVSFATATSPGGSRGELAGVGRGRAWAAALPARTLAPALGGPCVTLSAPRLPDLARNRALPEVPGYWESVRGGVRPEPPTGRREGSRGEGSRENAGRSNAATRRGPLATPRARTGAGQAGPALPTPWSRASASRVVRRNLPEVPFFHEDFSVRT